MSAFGSDAAFTQRVSARNGNKSPLFVDFVVNSNIQRRFGLPFEWVKAALGEGRIGSPIGVQISQPGNEIINFGPHLIDAALNVMNVPFDRQPVRALGAVEWSDALYQGVPVESQLAGTVHFSGGTRMVVEAGRHQAARGPVIRFDGDHGFVELRLSALDGEPGIARGCFNGSPEVFATDESFHLGATDTNLYVDRALKDILRSVKTGKPSRLDAATVLSGLEILLALFESANQREDGLPPARAAGNTVCEHRLCSSRLRTRSAGTSPS